MTHDHTHPPLQPDHPEPSSDYHFLGLALRELLIEKGIFNFPTATKQGSISFAHTAEDIDETLRQTEAVVSQLKH